MIKVLIADDHTLFRDGLKRIFSETEDIDVVAEAIDGKDILKKTREYDWDITLLDINLPDINGLDILKRILSVNASSCILVLSMYPGGRIRFRAIRRELLDILTKDSPADQLINVIRRLAKGGKYVNPELAEKLLLTSSRFRDIIHTLSQIESYMFLNSSLQGNL